MGVLLWTPDGFWGSTVYDIERALEGWRRANGAPEDGTDTKDDHDRRKAWFDSLPETL